MRDTIEFVLTYEDNVKRAIEEKRQDRALPRGGGGHSTRSDPTCQKALQEISSVGTVLVEYGPRVNGVGELRPLRDPEKWLSVAEATWKFFKPRRQGLLMRYRYKKGLTKADDLAKVLHLSRRMVFYLQADIYEFAERTARGIGLAAVKPHARLDEILLKLNGKSRESEDKSE